MSTQKAFAILVGLRFVKKDLLHVDHDYQRNENKDKITHLVERFNPAAFGALSVVERDGLFFVFDGQHRLLAVRRMPQITEVPVLVYELRSVTEEADAFLALNIWRTTPREQEKFRARLFAGHTEAVTLERMLGDLGLAVGHSASRNSVGCVSTLLRCLDNDPKALKAILPLAAMLSTPVGTIQGDVVKGLFYCYSNVERFKDFMDRLTKCTPEEVRKAIVTERSYYGKATPPVYGKAFLRLLNKSSHGQVKLRIPVD